MQTNFYHAQLHSSWDEGVIVKQNMNEETGEAILSDLVLTKEQTVAIASELNQADMDGHKTACESMVSFLERSNKL